MLLLLRFSPSIFFQQNMSKFGVMNYETKSLNDGYPMNLQYFCQRTVPWVASAEDLMKMVDTNGDGEIDFQEFMQMMRS